MTNSKGIGIAVGFSLRLVRVSVPYYPPAIVSFNPQVVCPGVPVCSPPLPISGRLSVDWVSPQCTCDKSGCVMAYASGIGILRTAYEAIRPRRRSGARRAAAARGDATAGETLQLAGRYAGLALAAAAQILDPVEMSQLGEEIGILDAAACRIRCKKPLIRF